MQAARFSVTTSPAIHVGCSGWVYKHWRGILYPEGLPQTRWFERYAAEFDTVEINNSFYRLPTPETFAKWRDQAPVGFHYAVKANRFITQAKNLIDCEQPLERMMGAARHLGDRLGPMLYQLPPTLKVNLERLESFLKILPGDTAAVFEFRDASWYGEATSELLARHGASICVHDMAACGCEPMAVGPAAYVRLHGTAGKYHGRYSSEALEGWARWSIDQCQAGRSVWIYFNNDIHGHAIHDARALKAMVERLVGAPTAVNRSRAT